MLLFLDETARVLAPNGVLLWINQLRQDGPLYCRGRRRRGRTPRPVDIS